MKSSRKIITFILISLIVVLSPAFAAEFDIQITSDKEIYYVGETAFFNITVYKNGELLTGKVL